MKNNFVAKHASKFNRAATHEDRKKRERKGYCKHKGKECQANIK